MKKLLFVATLGVASFMSAKEMGLKVSANPMFKVVCTNYEVSQYSSGGICTIYLYRDNGNNTSTLVRAFSTYTDSSEACDAKAASVQAQLNVGISPDKVN